MRDGPITFAAWMEACLYDATGGYYMRSGRKTGAGADADFATNPTLHPFLAHCVAREIEATWNRCDKPARFEVVEFGGGEGTLARDALAWLDANSKDLALAVTWTHIERSPTHRAAQQSGDSRLRWADAMTQVDAGFVLAHEFLDALPFHWLEWRGGWHEVHVAAAGQRFAEKLMAATSAAVAAAPQVPVAPGTRVVAMAAAKSWFGTVARGLGRGSFIVVDYGDRGNRLWGEARPDGSVRTFRGQTPGSAPLRDAGQQDITASIDFALTKQWGQAVGLHESSFASQEEFLLHHGILDALNAADRTSRSGASDYLRLRQLLLPTGLGQAFKVQLFDKA